MRGRNELLKAIITPQDCNLNALSAMIATLSARSCEKREKEKRRGSRRKHRCDTGSEHERGGYKTRPINAQDYVDAFTKGKGSGKGAKDILPSLMAHVSSCYEKGLKESDC